MLLGVVMKYEKDSKRPFCFECGRQLSYVAGEPVFVVRDYYGSPVKMHKDCAKKSDERERK